MQIRFLLFTVLMSAAASLQSTDSAQIGSIQGEVLDATGSPISGAKIFDEPMEAVRTGKDHFAMSNENGKFLLNDVPVGKTMVIATKTEDGYPDARFAVFSGNEILPVVQVEPDQVTSGVIVKLLLKGGTLSGKVMDTRTKLAIPLARIILSRFDHPTWAIETNVAKDGAFSLVIPAMPMHFSIKATGFRDWNYEQSDFSKNHSPLRLSPESKQEYPIFLEPTI
jgi:Carboxypeptidase regulatory-like domain